MSDLLAEVDKFRSWAATNPSTGRYGEWECDYMEWAILHDAVLKFVASHPFDAWSRVECAQVLYAIARDNEIQYLAREIRKRHPELLQPLARTALDIGECDDRWQLAVELGCLGAEPEALLLEMTCDENEYVRRKALESLLRIESSMVEEVALAAWHRPDAQQQWARMMALYCLHHIASPQLEGLLAQAEVDERQFLREYAIRIRRESLLTNILKVLGTEMKISKVLLIALLTASQPIIASETPDPAEQTVIVHFNYGSTDLKPLSTLESKLESAIKQASAGEFDGDEIAADGHDGYIYMYGPSADKLFDVIKPVLTTAPFMKNAKVVKRYGPPGVATKRIEVIL